jgi:hypothetical protein
LGAALSLLVYGVVKAPDNGWGSAQTIGCLAGAAVLLAIFLVIERRSAAPLVRLDIFRNRSVAAANALVFLAGLVIFGMFFFLSLYEQFVLGYAPLEAGLSFVPLALSITVAAGIASVLVTRFGSKYIIVTGMGMATMGLIFFARIPVHGRYAADLLPGILVVACGLGFALVPLQIAAVTGVRRDEVGLAAGLVEASHQIGGALGLAMLSTISTTRFNNVIAADHLRLGALAPFGQLSATATARVDGYHYAFGACASMLVVGPVLALTLLPPHRVAAVAPELVAA